MEMNRRGPFVRVDCPAKVNLFLEVLAKRSDGFHEIETLMVAISVYDSVQVTARDGGRIDVDCGWASGWVARGTSQGGSGLGPLPAPHRNLVYLAAERLRDRAGVEHGATIQVVKRIPSEAGLGGASSDAAATLVALNQLWGLEWDRSRLLPIAAELGSDVPFFLSRQQRGALAAVCRGRGERITSVEGIPRLPLVIVKPPEGLSTAAVYRRCRVPAEPAAVEPLVAALRAGHHGSMGQRIFNRLQETGEELSPRIAWLRRTWEQLDVVGHAMSGSGSSYYAVCRTAMQARQLSARLRSMLPGQVFHASTV